MEKLSKQFGVWMDSHHATVAGNDADGNFTILAHIANPAAGSNSSEKAQNHLEETLQHKFFKQITTHMQNVDEIFVTGTGDAQEQFIKYLAGTPQYKKAKSTIGTSNKMEDAAFLELVITHFKTFLYPA